MATSRVDPQAVSGKFRSTGRTAAEGKARAGKPKKPTLAKVGRALVQEMNELMDELGPNHPNLHARLLDYISTLSRRHPDWQRVMDRAREDFLNSHGRIRSHEHQ